MIGEAEKGRGGAMPGDLVCPRCRIPFTDKDGMIHCERCGATGAFRDGIYDLIGEGGSYWGEIPAPEMEAALESARQDGWKTAARNIGLKYRGLGEYTLSNARVDWLFHCLDFARLGSCLDLGSGWGTLSFGLARYFGEVWSLEAVRQRVAFQRIRQQQEHVDNIRLVRADWLRLPFPDETFDLVVANGVLEWLGLSDYSRNPRQVQQDFLREARRVLKPGGCLYVGTENRFGISFFAGARDHSGLPFTSLLPRRLADLAVRLGRRTQGEYHRDKRMKEEWRTYLTYTYDFRGYQKLLREAGFDAVDIYWTFSYNSPKYSGRCDDASFSFLLKLLRKNIFTLRRWRSFLIWACSLLPGWLMPALARTFIPCFLIYAHKGTGGVSFESQLVQSAAPGCRFLRISGSHGVYAKINYFLLKGARAVSVVKFARFKEGASYREREKEAMARFNNIEITGKTIGPITVFVEPPIKGEPCRLFDLAQNRKVLAWLLDFQTKTGCGVWDAGTLAGHLDYLNDFLRESHAAIPGELRAKVWKSLAQFVQWTSGVTLAKNARHGDFCRGNVLIDNDGRIHVTDWEFYREESEPLFDIMFYIISAHVEVNPKSAFTRQALLDRGKYSRMARYLMSEFARAKGLPEELMVQAVPYVLARCLYRATSDKEDNRHLDAILYLRLLESWTSA